MDYTQSLLNIKNAMNFISLFDESYAVIFDFKDDGSFTIFTKNDNCENFMFDRSCSKKPYASININAQSKHAEFYYFDCNCTYEFDLYTQKLIFYKAGETLQGSDLLSIQSQFAKLLQILQK